MRRLFSQLRQSGRTLAASPGFSAVAVLTLALGLGANTAIFSVVQSVLLDPLPYPDADRLVMIFHSYPKLDLERATVTVGGFRRYAEETRSFAAMAAATGWRTPQNLTGGGEPLRVRPLAVTARYFDVLGVGPERGRTFVEGDDVPGRDRIAVLSQALFRDRFGGAPEVVGAKISLDGEPYTVVGVMPAGFGQGQVDLWIPLAFPPEMLNNFGTEFLNVIARLAPGVSIEQARAEMATMTERLLVEFPEGRDMGWHLLVDPMAEVIVGDVRPALLVLSGAVGLVLAIACANVANLLLARGAGRRREIAVRAALGAGRWRIARQLLGESVLLSLVGGALGLLLATWGVDLLARGLPEQLAAVDVGIDWPVLGFALAIAVGTGLLFGLAPALQLSRPALASELTGGVRSSAPGPRRQPLRAALVAGEIALSLMLLVSAGLLIRSFSRLQHVDPGFSTDGALTFRLSLPQARYAEDHRVAAFWDRLLERLGSLPGVEAAGAVSSLPFSGGMTSSYNLEARPPAPGQPEPHDSVRVATPGYFAALDIPLRQGRLFTAADREGSPPVALVDESIARRYWPEGGPHGGPIGKRLSFGFENTDDGPLWREIVGVVGYVRNEGMDASGSKGQVYLPLGQQVYSSLAITVETTGDPAALAEQVRREVVALDPEQPIYEVQPVSALIAESLSPARFATSLLALFAALAVVLAVVGIYGVVAYSVAQRTHEIGIRMALGADRERVVKLVVGQGAALAGIGVAAGLLLAAFATRFLERLLFEVSATDPLTFAAVPVLLAAVALAASWIPARRATRVEPSLALRSEV